MKFEIKSSKFKVEECGHFNKEVRSERTEARKKKFKIKSSKFKVEKGWEAGSLSLAF
ncbi:MAG: hypothetical protein AB1659_12765 [Thermodesulfobacteriota bacterium]